MRRRTVAAAGIAGAVVCAWLWMHRPGVVVVVRNHSLDTLTDVVVRTRGWEFPLGDIPDGEEREAGITARGESSATVCWTQHGQRHEDYVVGYFEGSDDGASSYGGVVETTIGASTWTTEGSVMAGTLVFLPARRPLPAGRRSQK